MGSIQQCLRRAKDKMGWKPPYHHHYRVIRNGVDSPWNSDFPPIYIINCSPSKCEALGCPRTESGFPEVQV